MYPFLVENMADGEAYIQNLNIEVRSKEVCYFMCGEKFGRILYIPTTELYLHGLLDPVSRRMRPTLTETEPFS